MLKHEPRLPFCSLPSELQLTVLSHLPATSIPSCALVSSHLHALCCDEGLWSLLAVRDFGVHPPKSDKFSPRIFYQDVLYRFRGCVGLWQRTNLQFYSSIIRVQPTPTSLNIEEIVPGWSVFEPVRALPFLSITKSRSDTNIVIKNSYQMFCDASAKVLLISSSEEKKKKKEDREGKERQSEEGDILNFIFTGEDVSESEDSQKLFFDFKALIYGADKVVDTGLLLTRFLQTYDSRSIFSFTRLPLLPPAVDPSSSPPVTSGLFQGTYSSHGLEFIQLLVPGPSLLNAQGIKVTGDPNVPFKEVSFAVDQPQCLVMDREVQSSVQNIEAYMAEGPVFVPFQEGREGEEFVVPGDCHLDQPLNYDKCLGRWSCQCQIAGHMFHSPKMIPGNLVLFDNDTFAVIFLDIRSIALYRRVKGVENPLRTNSQ